MHNEHTFSTRFNPYHVLPIIIAAKVGIKSCIDLLENVCLSACACIDVAIQLVLCFHEQIQVYSQQAQHCLYSAWVAIAI